MRGTNDRPEPKEKGGRKPVLYSNNTISMQDQTQPSMPHLTPIALFTWLR
jgi:hypothetical protein